jgi:uncharacterized membrane protein
MSQNKYFISIMDKKYIPRIIILLGLIIHSISSYFLPWIGYQGLINLNIMTIVGMIIMLTGIVLLFYYD